MTIAVVGKYVTLRDAYLSVMEALYHGGFHHGADVEIRWVASDDLGGEATADALGEVDGVLIPGGFGIRGVEGKVAAGGTLASARCRSSASASACSAR